MFPFTRDSWLVMFSLLMTIWMIISTVLTGSTILRELAEGRLSAKAVVRGVSAMIGLLMALWALTLAVHLL
jgi:hypothetical protein